MYKDTEAKLYRISEEAPLKPPKREEDQAAYEAKKADYIARWKPVVDAAYEKAKKKVRPQALFAYGSFKVSYSFLGQGRTRAVLSPLLACGAAYV